MRVAAIILAAMLGLLGSAQAQTPGPDELRAHALALVNEARLAHDLPPLALGRAINAAAEAHAADMRRRRYYAHVSPEGEAVGDRYVRTGGSRWQLTAENIANCPDCRAPPDLDIVDLLHRGWMDSPGHRDNILTPGLETFGFAVVADRTGGLYAVETFAGPGLPRGLRPGEPVVPLARDGQVQRALALLDELRRQHAVPDLEPSPALDTAAATLLARHGADETRMTDGKNLRAALPVDQRGNWPSLGVLVGTCGGCGAVPADADIRFFLQQWREQPEYRAMLRDPRWTHVGFIVVADGEGKKTALALFGKRG